jgi:hypothetical protein
MRTKVNFESRQDTDSEPFFVNGNLIPLEAVAGEIKDGPHKGMHIFSSRSRAEEFCWKHDFDPVFDEEQPE